LKHLQDDYVAGEEKRIALEEECAAQRVQLTEVEEVMLGARQDILNSRNQVDALQRELAAALSGKDAMEAARKRAEAAEARAEARAREAEVHNTHFFVICIQLMMMRLSHYFSCYRPF